MNIIKLLFGQTEDMDIRFAEGLFSQEDEEFYIFAITSDELVLLVRSQSSLVELYQNMQDNSDDDFISSNYEINSWSAQNKTTCRESAELDLESVLAYCMECDLETYQCWHNDGNEGLYEASESDAGLAFVVVHDLLATNGFSNVQEMLEDDDTLIDLLEEIDFNSEDALL